LQGGVERRSGKFPNIPRAYLCGPRLAPLI
jgi:hypothetical protein